MAPVLLDTLGDWLDRTSRLSKLAFEAWVKPAPASSGEDAWVIASITF